MCDVTAHEKAAAVMKLPNSMLEAKKCSFSLGDEKLEEHQASSQAGISSDDLPICVEALETLVQPYPVFSNLDEGFLCLLAVELPVLCRFGPQNSLAAPRNFSKFQRRPSETLYTGCRIRRSGRSCRNLGSWPS